MAKFRQQLLLKLLSITLFTCCLYRTLRLCNFSFSIFDILFSGKEWDTLNSKDLESQAKSLALERSREDRKSAAIHLTDCVKQRAAICSYYPRSASTKNAILGHSEFGNCLKRIISYLNDLTGNSGTQTVTTTQTKRDSIKLNRLSQKDGFNILNIDYPEGVESDDDSLKGASHDFDAPKGDNPKGGDSKTLDYDNFLLFLLSVEEALHSITALFDEYRNGTKSITSTYLGIRILSLFELFSCLIHCTSVQYH